MCVWEDSARLICTRLVILAKAEAGLGKNEKKAEINSAELKGLVQLCTGMGKFTNQTVHEPV